jgi:hypothetical protein
LIQSVQLDEECHKHIFPVHTPNPKYEPLPLLKITGALALLSFFLLISVFILFFEIMWNKWRDTKLETENEFQTFDIRLPLHIGDTFSSMHREKIFAKYLQLLEVIDCCE